MRNKQENKGDSENRLRLNNKLLSNNKKQVCL